MQHPGFFEKAGPYKLSELADRLQIVSSTDTDPDIYDVKTLRDAGPNDIAFYSNRKYANQLNETRAAACLVAPVDADKVPDGTIPLVVAEPYHVFADMLWLFYPGSRYPRITDPACDARISPSAVIEDESAYRPDRNCRP